MGRIGPGRRRSQRRFGGIAAVRQFPRTCVCGNVRPRPRNYGPPGESNNRHRGRRRNRRRRNQLAQTAGQRPRAGADVRHDRLSHLRQRHDLRWGLYVFGSTGANVLLQLSYLCRTDLRHGANLRLRTHVLSALQHVFHDVFGIPMANVFRCHLQRCHLFGNVRPGALPDGSLRRQCAQGRSDPILIQQFRATEVRPPMLHQCRRRRVDGGLLD